jgi:alpha-beta hydrolase superfamily lysophospholipase
MLNAGSPKTTRVFGFLFAYLLVLLLGFQLPVQAQFTQASPQILEIEQAPFFDGLHVPTYTWTKVNDSPKAIVVLLHGGCLSGQSYRTLGQQLAKENYLAVSADMRGYGKWYHDQFGTPYEKTFHYEQSMQDFKDIIGKLRLHYPGKPVYILGESLGANACFHIAASSPELIDGIIAVSTYAKPNWFVDYHMFIHAVQVITRPWSKLNVTPYLRARLSEDKALAQEHFSDPYARDKQSIKELFKSLVFNIRGRRLSAQVSDYMPVLMVHGELDKLCSPKATIHLFDTMTLKDKTLLMVQNKGHLLMETSQINPSLFKAICLWMDKQSGRQ